MIVVTIMNYPDNPEYNKMCCIFIKMLFRYNDCSLIILCENGVSETIKQYASKYNVKIVECKNCDTPFIDTHNIKFKLWNLSRIIQPFIFLDADIFCLHSLQPLWKLKETKPFIGVNHQKIPNHTAHLTYDFLNSGVQIVGNPEWYSYEKIQQCFYTNGYLSVPGYDQAALYDYCKSIGYDYTHPEVTAAWNSCAGYTEIISQNGDYTPVDEIEYYGIWNGITHNNTQYQVYLNHYWNEFKPWKINCPIYNNFNET
jgi:hypothetical protein